MKEITRLMVDEYKIMRLGYDFAGYKVVKASDVNFHHLIVAKRNCKERGFGEGYYKWNGAILHKDNFHPYLHIIEHYDYDMFLKITSYMIDENIMGRLDVGCIRRIHDVLNEFEREYGNKRSGSGRILIKKEFRERERF